MNRRISRLALPLLYRNIEDTDFGANFNGFKKFILTLLVHPTKAAHVKVFGVNKFGGRGDEPRWPVDEESRKHERIVEQKPELSRDLETLMERDEDGQEGRESWEKHFFKEPHLSETLALMLARLPNLQTLATSYVGYEFWEMAELLTDAMHRASKDQETGVKAPFPKLERVIVGGLIYYSTRKYNY